MSVELKSIDLNNLKDAKTPLVHEIGKSKEEVKREKIKRVKGFLATMAKIIGFIAAIVIIILLIVYLAKFFKVGSCYLCGLTKCNCAKK